MSSGPGFPGGYPDFSNVNGAGRSIPVMNLNNNPQGSYRSPLAGILSDPYSQIGLRQPNLIGKRSLAEFQQHQQLQHQAAIFLRNVKPRGYFKQSSPIDFLTSPEVSNSSSSASSVRRYGVPVLQQLRSPTGNGNFNGVMNSHQNSINYNRVSNISLPNLVAKQTPANPETEGKMMNRLQELEKLLDEEDGENDAVSVVTNSEWSETFQKLLGPGQLKNPENPVCISPATSSSSCASSSPSPAASICPKQLISDVASAISDGKPDSAAEILTQLNRVSNPVGTPENRLSCYMVSAFRSRLNVNPTADEKSATAPAPASELYRKEHVLSTQLLYDKSPCFKLAIMAANNIILEAVSGSGQPENKIHVVDFDIGQGVQYVYLLHQIAAARAVHGERQNQKPISLKLTTFTDFGNGGAERLELVGDGLKSLSNKLGVFFSFNVLSLNLSDLSKEALMADAGEILVVNFAFKLNKLPDESVTVDNLRDEVLRRVKGLSPAAVTVVEQEMNANTASFTTRVNEASGYYGALLDSFEATIPRDSPERVKIEEGLSRRLVNSVAFEGRDRVERCEVFAKWRARLSMAGFEPKPLSQLSAESLLAKLNSGTRGNPGFTVKNDSGGIGFGWKGRTLTVASAWH